MDKVTEFNVSVGLKEFCGQSKIGTHRCCVETRYGWSCDFCLCDELVWLNENGVETVNSCCGHGDGSLAFILVRGLDNISFMKDHGYERVYRSNSDNLYKYGVTEWIPKTVFLYEEESNEN